MEKRCANKISLLHKVFDVSHAVSGDAKQRLQLFHKDKVTIMCPIGNRLFVKVLTWDQVSYSPPGRRKQIAYSTSMGNRRKRVLSILTLKKCFTIKYTI